MTSTAARPTRGRRIHDTGCRATSSTAVLFGATSQIGLAVVRELVVRSADSRVVLAGRPSEHRQSVADALRADHGVSELDWDAYRLDDPVEVMEQAAARAGRSLDLVVLAAGTLPPGLPDLADGAAARDLQDSWLVNAVAPTTLLVAAVQHLARVGGGQVVVISSAAAVRPRRQILTYSLAKQATDALALQLVEPARAQGVDVHVVRPGHVRTRMTMGLPVPPLARTSEQVARDVVTGVARGHRVVWSPAAMRPVMGVLRLTPRMLLPRSLR